MKHFSHVHPLMFNEGTNDDKIRVCNGCSVPIFKGSPLYTCKECEFYLHKTCAELPLELTHTKHPQHTLFLRSNWPYQFVDARRCVCYSCLNLTLNNFFYHCPYCQIYLDVICASPTEITVQHSSHKQHPLVLTRRPTLMFCDACGEEHKGRFYTCNSCCFYIHQECAWFPSTIKHSDHDHDLHLTYSVKDDLKDVHWWECRICWGSPHVRFWMYCCRQCLCAAHLKCAMTKFEPFMSILLPRISWRPDPGEQIAEDVKKNVILLPPANEFVSVVGHLTLAKEEGLEELIEINDLISHEHPLILVNESISSHGNSPLSNESRCDVCFRSLSPRFYCCKECNLRVHEMCLKLPAKIQHPCHPEHPIKLLAKSPDKFFGMYRCCLCQRRSNGICFHCQDCGIFLDVKCALLPKSIIHEAHPHHVLGLKKKDIAYCFCRQHSYHGEFVYTCNTCDFGLHCKCVLNPSTTRSKYEKHDLKLIYDPSRGNSDEYYCQICEIRIDQRLWFYHCVECDNSFHIRCDTPEDHVSFCITGFPSLHFYSNLKFGVTFRIECHPHALTFVYHVEHSLCNICHLIIIAQGGIAFECSECNYVIHFHCCEEYLKNEKGRNSQVVKQEEEHED